MISPKCISKFPKLSCAGITQVNAGIVALISIKLWKCSSYEKIFRSTCKIFFIGYLQFTYENKTDYN